MSFWKRVNGELEYLGMTRKELSAITGIPLFTIGKSYSRDSIPNAESVLKISRALKVSVDYLITGKDAYKRIIKESDLSKKVFLYDKYSRLIIELESFPPEKQKLLEKSFEAIMELAK